MKKPVLITKIREWAEPYWENKRQDAILTADQLREKYEESGNPLQLTFSIAYASL